MLQDLAISLTEEKRDPSTRFTEHRHFYALLIFVVAVLLFLPTLGAVGIFDSSDGYYSEGAREMIERGDLLTPILNYANYFEKPILNYWLIALCYKIFGVTTFAARLPSAISTLILSLLIYYRSRSAVGCRAAVMSALIFLTSPIVLIVGRFSLTDMPLCLFVSAAILLIFNGVFQRQSKVLGYGYTAVALAVLTKGPVALLLIFGALFSFLLITTRIGDKLWQRVKRFRLVSGLFLTAVISLPWYVAIHVATGGQFTNTFFIGQNMGRALGKVNHTAPWFYYLILFWGSFFPWSILLFPVSLQVIKPKKIRLLTARRQFLFFCFCWASFVFVFYSFVPTKLPTYILPMYPACAILLGTLIDDALKKRRDRELKMSAIALSVISLLLVICLPPFITGAISMKTLFSAKDFVASKMSAIFTGSYFSLELWAVALAAASLVFTWLLFLRLSRQAVQFFLGAMVAISVCFLPLVIHHFYDQRQAGFAKLIRLVKVLDKPVATVEAFQPSACFELHKHVAVLKNPADLSEFLKSPGLEHLILVPESRMSFLLWLKSPPKVICSNGGWTLVNVQ
jgi:4-amino-4-deoxy-L-arabinose transferase-like glycosyltransferase